MAPNCVAQNTNAQSTRGMVLNLYNENFVVLRKQY
jgi:hypothetical protein